MTQRRWTERLIVTQTRPLSPPLTPELRYYGADELTALWDATEAALAERALAPPFWAFAWPGGQALARLLLDRPKIVEGRVALALASGAALEALAAAKAGARRVVANDIDPTAAVAALLNARLNGVAVETWGGNLLSGDERTASSADAPPLIIEDAEVILVGDAFYEAELSERLENVLAKAAARGARILVGDPTRGFPPSDALRRVLSFELAVYDVPTSIELENVPSRRARVISNRP